VQNETFRVKKMYHWWAYFVNLVRNSILLNKATDFTFIKNKVLYDGQIFN